MAANKTRPTDQSVEDHLDQITDPARRADCDRLVEMMAAITGAWPRMWGPSIVGFGSYHYRYDSGREGDMCRTGFASRQRDISIYLLASGPDQQTLLGELGRHRMGRSCLYVRRLADVDAEVLEKLIRDSVDEIRRRYGD